MTAKKTSEEDAATLPLVGTELVRIVQSGNSKQTTISKLTPKYFVATFFGSSTFNLDGSAYSTWGSVNTVLDNTADFSKSGTTVNFVTVGLYKIELVVKFTPTTGSFPYQWVTGDVMYGAGITNGDAGNYVSPSIISNSISSSSGQPYQNRVFSHDFIVNITSANTQLLPFVFAKSSSSSSSTVAVAIQMAAIRLSS